MEINTAVIWKYRTSWFLVKKIFFHHFLLMIFSIFYGKNEVSKCCSFGDRKNLKISNLKAIWKYRTSMFITSQKNFITIEKSIFSMFKRQDDKL